MKKKKSLGKKGNVLVDLLLVPVMLFIIVVSLFLGYYFYDIVRTETDLFKGEAEGGSQMRQEVGIAGDTVTSMFPYIFIMVVASLLIALILSAYFVESSVVFMVVGLIFLMITIVVSVPISNFYEEFVGSGDFENTNDQFSIPNNILANMPYYVFIIGAVFIFVLFGKKSSGESEGRYM